MSSIKRSGTLNTLKRSNTMQTIKRAGTGAWKWINAEDVNVNQNNPVGVSFFQRSNTYKRLNDGGTFIGRTGSSRFKRRPTFTQNQVQGNNYQYSNPQHSYSVNMNRYGSQNSGYGSQNNGYGTQNNGYGNQNNGYSSPNNGYSSPNNGYSSPNNGYGNQNNGYSSPNNGYSSPNNGYSSPNNGYGSQNNGYGRSNTGYGSPNTSYSNPNTSYGNSSINYGTSIKRPEPAAEKYVKTDATNGRKRNSKIPSVLYDPEVRKQLEQMKQHKPYFMYFVTLFQIAVFLFELYNNYVAMKNPFVGMNQNPMLGPSSGVLISMGARFVPCIKEIEYNQIYCPPGIKGTMDFNTTNVCNMNEVCGFGMKEGDKPNQWYRFITPIFIHCGLLHILFNLSFQVRTGIQMEKDFGTLRIAIIYMASGIFGFVFEANSAGIQPSVGCSGSLYGLMACLLLDLIQSWKLIIGPWKELIKMLFIIAFSLGIGLLPFVDNYAHIGGFIMGILTGLVLLPSIIFSKRDLRIKRILMILSIFLSIGLFVWVFRQFYYSENECKWCHYLNCLPIGNWCDSLATQTTTTTVTTTTQPPSPYNQ